MMNRNRKGFFSIRFISVLLSLTMMLTLFPAGLLSTALASGKEDLVFASISDIHYFAKEDRGNYSDEFLSEMGAINNQILQLDSLLASSLDAVVKLKEERGLKYLLIPGDLTYNGEKSGHTELAAILEQFEKDSGVKVFVINGNHDVLHDGATTYKNDVKEPAVKTTPEDFVKIYSKLVYGLDGIETYKPPLAEYAGALSYAISLDGGYRLIAVDAGKYTFDVTSSGKPGAETGGVITASLMKWIGEQTAKAKAAGETVITMCHWNVAEMNYLQKNVLQGFVIDNMTETADSLADLGVHYLFSGHNHATDISTHYSDKGEVLYNIQTAALCDFPNTFRLNSFTKNADKSVTGKFEVFDVDYVTPIAGGETTYPAPYKESSFGITYADGDPNAFIFSFLKNIVDGYLGDIEAAGGLLKYIEKTADIKIESTIRQLLIMDIKLPGTDFVLLSANNIMAFLNDLEAQITAKFIDDPQYTYNLLEGIVDKFANIQVSQYPCDKFVDAYGFGSKTTPGTLGEAIFSAIAYMHNGNEDSSGDRFINDVIAKFESGENSKKIVDLLIETAVQDLLQEEILGALKFNISKLFPTTGALIESLLRIFLNNDLSYLNLVNSVIGLLDIQYGSSIEEIVENLTSSYLTESWYQGIGSQFAAVVEGCCSDGTLDYDVEYTYSGPVKIDATSADYRLPSMATVVFGSDPKTTFNLSWYTKYSVTGTDIEIIKAKDGEAPLFTGTPTTGDSIIADSYPVTSSYPGVDLGFFGFFPYELKLVRHTINLSGLEAGEKYYFRIGDAEKGWWSERGLLSPSKNDNSFRFMFVSDTQSQSKGQYDSTWGNLAQQASAKFGDIEFIVHGGDFVDHGDNANQWQWCLDAAQAELLSTPLMPTAGNHEDFGDNAILNYFNLNGYPTQDTTSGVYYSFEYENTYFAVLNSNNLSNKDALSKEQIEWLKEDSAKSDAQWKIVSIHKPAYSNGTHAADSDCVAIREQFAKLMPELGIDLVLQGHDHVYMRTDALKDGKAVFYSKSVAIVEDKPVETMVQPDGTIYIIAGKGGVKNYKEIDESIIELYVPSLQKTVNTKLPTFATIKVVSEVLMFEAYEVDGDSLKRIDVFALQKNCVELLLGDVNLNEKIDTSDARTTLRQAVGIEILSKELQQVADVNGDGKVSTFDARTILRAAVNIEPLEKKYITVYTNNPAFFL